MGLEVISQTLLIAIAAMKIAGEEENIPSWVADWPHCCDFRGDTGNDLRWSAMLLEA